MKTLTEKEFRNAVCDKCPVVETASGADVHVSCVNAMDWYHQTIQSKDGYGYVRIKGDFIFLGVENWPGSKNVYEIGGKQ